MKKLHKGFTLAEILLAMLMMGIIAVSILPGITKNAEQQLFITQLKKVQNELQQAMLIISAKNKNSLANVFTNRDYVKYLNNEIGAGDARRNAVIFAYAIKTVLGTNCIYYEGTNKTTNNILTNPTAQAQFYVDRNPHYMDTAKTAEDNANYPVKNSGQFVAMNLKDGATVRTVITDETCSSAGNNNNRCGILEVDLNGRKKPNTVGKDIHFFWIINSDDGIVPFGEDGRFDNNVGGVFSCSQDAGTGKFNNAEDTYGCTARALREGRITYY